MSTSVGSGMDPASSSMQSTSSGTHQSKVSGQRETFAAAELAIVLSHYDIGPIEQIIEYPRGSRKAPKLVITSTHGKFLLKRRAHGKDDPFKVAFCHGLQMQLAAMQFPLPHLIGTRIDNNSMLQVLGNVYELFEYIPGQSYPQSLESTFDSGRVLGLYHKLLEHHQSQWTPPSGSYHLAPSVESGLRAILSRVAGDARLQPTLEFLYKSYKHAAESVESHGIDHWPKQIVHADWHPGNMLYRDNHVVAVIDYDSARLLARIIDIANGALQFSIIGGDDDVARWPDYLDESRFKRFLRGYDEVVLLSQGEIATVPWLMIEALIAEAVFPIAATGTFGRMDGDVFLKMVQRKVIWLQKNAPRLIELAAGSQ